MATKLVNLLALADNPYSEYGSATMKCGFCRVNIAEIKGVVTLVNGEVLAPIVNIKTVNEIGAALAAHLVTTHEAVVRDMVAESQKPF